MITEAIMTVVFLPIRWVLEAIPTVTWPTWFSTSGPDSVVTLVDSWGDSLGLIGGWFPLSSAFDAVDFVMVCFGINLAVRLIRVVVSHVTGGGGAT